MKSGLEGRNNVDRVGGVDEHVVDVSMKSGLEGRNNAVESGGHHPDRVVSMKSGLEGRNNHAETRASGRCGGCLNEVRPRRPEQWGCPWATAGARWRSQ